MTVPLDEQTAREWLAAAVEEARTGRAEGGIPIGAALIATHGAVRGSVNESRPRRRMSSRTSPSTTSRAVGTAPPSSPVDQSTNRPDCKRTDESGCAGPCDLWTAGTDRVTNTSPVRGAEKCLPPLWNPGRCSTVLRPGRPASREHGR
jgi:hypothetical protein